MQMQQRALSDAGDRIHCPPVILTHLNGCSCLYGNQGVTCFLAVTWKSIPYGISIFQAHVDEEITQAERIWFPQISGECLIKNKRYSWSWHTFPQS